jgi:Xaa-Pro aminopeptidase
MKQDLDALMAERGLDAIVVAGRIQGNPALYYMANGARILHGHVFKKRGTEPILVCSPIDREEAAASGLAVLTTDRYDYEGILRTARSPLDADIELYRRIFADLQIQGRVGFYGTADRGSAWRFLSALQAQIPGIEVFGEIEPTLIDLARATKDASEAKRIREVGRRTADVFAETLAFLKQHRVRDGCLVQPDGTPLTIGRVHREIRRLLAEAELEVPEGVIFAIGRDAAVPHNKGNPADPIRLGQTIVFDMGTREAGGGYYFDMTRTFCLAYAPPEVEQAYRDVRDCLEMLLPSYQAGEETRTYMERACAFLEARGHPTIASTPGSESGFVHGLGHGIGLAVHEEPGFSLSPTANQRLQPGHIFTCEPGVYYPERGFGVRLEDVVWIDAEGRGQRLTDFPKELVIPVP